MADFRNFFFLVSTLYCKNAEKYRKKIDKKIPQNKKEQVFWRRRTGLQGGSGLQFMKN